MKYPIPEVSTSYYDKDHDKEIRTDGYTFDSKFEERKNKFLYQQTKAVSKNIWITCGSITVGFHDDGSMSVMIEAYDEDSDRIKEFYYTADNTKLMTFNKLTVPKKFL